MSGETTSRDCKSGKHGAISFGLSKNSHTVARAAGVSNESSKCNIDHRLASCHDQRKTLRVLRNTDHDGCHWSERDLYERVKTEELRPAFYGAKLLIHSFADKRFRSGADRDQPRNSCILEEKESETSESERIIPLPPLPKQTADQTHSASEDEVNKARGALKVLLLERQIIGSALTTIFESETKGIISQVERDRLVNKYKVDLQQLEKTIEEYQRTVDLYDLEKSREELVRDFNAKLAEMDGNIMRA